MAGRSAEGSKQSVKSRPLCFATLALRGVQPHPSHPDYMPRQSGRFPHAQVSLARFLGSASRRNLSPDPDAPGSPILERLREPESCGGTARASLSLRSRAKRPARPRSQAGGAAPRPRGRPLLVNTARPGSPHPRAAPGPYRRTAIPREGRGPPRAPSCSAAPPRGHPEPAGRAALRSRGAQGPAAAALCFPLLLWVSLPGALASALRFPGSVRG